MRVHPVAFFNVQQSSLLLPLPSLSSEAICLIVVGGDTGEEGAVQACCNVAPLTGGPIRWVNNNNDSCERSWMSFRRSFQFVVEIYRLHQLEGNTNKYRNLGIYKALYDDVAPYLNFSDIKF